jgi:hypothetical protein
MDYILILGDVITGHPGLGDGTPQQLAPGVVPFSQRLPDKNAAFALKDQYLTRFPRAQVEIQSSDGMEKWVFQNSMESLVELMASDADAVDPRAGAVLRKFFKRMKPSLTDRSGQDT